MAIQLQNYDTIFENAVYGKDIFIAGNGDDRPHGWCKAILVLQSYIEPTEDSVIAYLQRRVKELETPAQLVLPGSFLKTEMGLLETLIINLPKTIRDDVAKGDENCLGFIRGHTSALPLDVPEEFLFLRYCLIPKQVITKYQNEGAIEDSKWYERTLTSDSLTDNGFGEKWHMSYYYRMEIYQEEMILVF